MSRQVFLWIVLTYTYSQTCRAYISARIEQSPANYKSPMYDTYQHNLENIDIIKKKDIEDSLNNPSYKNVIENLRNSWQMPAGYLQKRGYMRKAKCFGNNCRGEPINSDKNKGNHLSIACKGCRDVQNGILQDNWNRIPENSLQGSPDSPVVEQLATTTTPKPGFLKKFKNLFSRKNTSALVEELPSLNKLTKTANLLQNDYEQLNDYIALQDSRENLVDWSNTLPRRSYRQGRNKHWMPSVLENRPCKDCPEIPSVNHNIYAKDIKTDELLKNLSQTDLDYVKNFVKCFKENKSKFLIDYLHVNPSTLAEANQTSTKVSTTTASTPVPSPSKPTTSAAKTNSTIQTTNNSPSSAASPCKESALKNVTIETSVKSPSESKAQKNEEPQCDVNNTATGVTPKQNQSAKNTVKPCNQRKSVNPEKLKFLAHLHHAVDEVGKPPHKSLNLKKIQEMINDARYNTPGTSDDGNENNCSTPIRLNELSLDLEVGGASVNNSKPINPLTINCLENNWGDVEAKRDWSETDAASQFLEGIQQGNQVNSFRIQPPYADNFLDQTDEVDGDSHTQDIDKGSRFLSKISKKREVAYSEDDILSDISSSLNKFTFSSPARTEHHHDDYYSEKNKDSNNDDDYYIDDDLPREETVGLRGGLRGRKKKKNRRLHMRHSYNKFEQSETNDENEETKPQNSETGGNVIFSDFDDIKFRMNPEQEKSIQTFIESLNSPPEVFSFDVDRFIKEPENGIDEDLKSELTPQRKFYEFIDTPAIENEQIPLLPSNLEAAHKEVSRNEDIGLDHARKRDLLRQYIKGVSTRLDEIDHPLEELKAEGRKMQESVSKREGEELLNDDTAMLTNFPKYYDEIYTNKLQSQTKPAEEVDDFVDKYYLLNDGSVDIYQPHKSISKAQYDPEGVQIDLDLNKKFKDLIFTHSSLKDKSNGKLRGNARY